MYNWWFVFIFFIFTNHTRCIHHSVSDEVSALSRSAWLCLDGLPCPGSQLDRAHGAPGATGGQPGCSLDLIGSHWFVSLSESRNFQLQQTSKEDFWWFLPIGSEGNCGWQVDISPDLLHPEFLTQKRNGFQSWFQSWQGISRHFLSIYFLDMEFWSTSRSLLKCSANTTTTGWLKEQQPFPGSLALQVACPWPCGSTKDSHGQGPNLGEECCFWNGQVIEIGMRAGECHYPGSMLNDFFQCVRWFGNMHDFIDVNS